MVVRALFGSIMVVRALLGSVVHGACSVRVYGAWCVLCAWFFLRVLDLYVLLS